MAEEILTRADQADQQNQAEDTATKGGAKKEEDFIETLRVITPDIEPLFEKPAIHDGTRIASALAKCVIPVKIKLIESPARILEQIDKMKRFYSDRLMPFEIVALVKELIISNSGDDNNEIIHHYQALSSENAYDILAIRPDTMALEERVDAFIDIIYELCSQMSSIRKQYASQEAFFLGKSQGVSVAIDRSIINSQIQNSLLELNKMSSGLEGYVILSQIKNMSRVVSAIMTLANNGKIWEGITGGTATPTTILSLLGYKISPSQMTFHKDIQQITGNLLDWESKKLTDRRVVNFLFVCERVRKFIEEDFMEEDSEKEDSEKEDPEEEKRVRK